jgi:predicted Zn-dependent protease
MKHFLTAACIFLAHMSFSQDLAELDRRNGFKDLKLGAPIDSVKNAEFKKDIKEKNEFPAKLYEVENPEYKSIGEVKVKKVEVKTYKDHVYEIIVITNKDTRLMKGMEKSFGKPTYILTTDTYNWKTSRLSLTFKDHSKNELRLTYRFYPLLKMMLEDKGKKIDDIATDF